MKAAWNRFKLRLKKVSVILTVGYMCMFLAGVAFTIATPITIVNASSQWQSYVWSAMLMMGGAFSASDLFTGLRGGELFGAPWIAGAAVLWGAALLWREWHNQGIAGAGTGLAWLMFGLALFVIARWGMLSQEFKTAKAAKAARLTG